MQAENIIRDLRAKNINPIEVLFLNSMEIEVRINKEDFKAACLFMHTKLSSSVMALFAVDKRQVNGNFEIRCVFLAKEIPLWVSIVISVAEGFLSFDSLACDIYSSALFERQIKEMFGIIPEGNPDQRSLVLHEEVCPEGTLPLRKDFTPVQAVSKKEYQFNKVEGDGIFEIPVGPVHAGIIGPGHFHFSVAGEPIVNLELRLGFTHRGVEKLFEGKTLEQGLKLSECVVGDSVIGYSWAFCRAAEAILGVKIASGVFNTRAICLELERIYNHFTAISGIALDVGFSFPAQFISVLKERVLRLNKKLSAHRYLKGVLSLGFARNIFDKEAVAYMLDELKLIKRDIKEAQGILYGSVSFMDRVDETGILRKKTAEDFGVVGLAGRSSGVSLDLRRVFPEGYLQAGFRLVKKDRGDVLSRLIVRLDEIEESLRLIDVFAKQTDVLESPKINFPVQGHALGAVEGARGPVIYWLEVSDGKIERCKIVDPSFQNWQGLSISVLGNIVPDFPVCNKSFDLSYAGNDL
ncbi:MAG: NADH-quinone oxidoreductase subunit C [Candidatus Omnitrophica bacterium]|jgi:Ni,Fe-hydrogenase III large subunit/Ni,Fe-hydrogenase III component G|nr:NADH-quinone oxidoreductase subunit C [Candidatus Omnitrophota bacterium]